MPSVVPPLEPHQKGGNPHKPKRTLSWWRGHGGNQAAPSLANKSWPVACGQSAKSGLPHPGEGPGPFSLSIPLPLTEDGGDFENRPLLSTRLLPRGLRWPLGNSHGLVGQESKSWSIRLSVGSITFTNSRLEGPGRARRWEEGKARV